MAIDGWYYLHTNGDLIYKRELGGTAADIRESSFARGLWPFDHTARECVWNILIEAGAAGANQKRIKELAVKWQCDDKDAIIYADFLGVKLSRDGNQQCATRIDFINLQESPAGFGDTNLDAMIDLCKTLGYRPSKMWGPTFSGLLKPVIKEQQNV